MAKRPLTKKKGPKGKKARAKAKLDRQWGETVDEKQLEAAKIRRGKSRLLPKQAPSLSQEPFQHEAEQEQFASHNDTIPEHSSGESDEEEEELQDDAFNLLLKSISKKSYMRQEASEEEDSMGSGDETSSQTNGGAMNVESCSESDNDEEDVDIEQAFSEPEDELADGGSSSDPFSLHFNRETLPEDKDELSKVLTNSQSITKVVTPFLEDSLHLQLPRALAGRLDLTDADDTSPSLAQQHWNKACHGIFQSNRKVLKQGWNRVNKSAKKANADGLVRSKEASLSSLQSALYPALASYTDVLFTAQTRENRDAVNNLMALHLLNHVLTTRGRIKRNNKTAREAEQGDDDGDLQVEDAVRDQGYTRPTVLVLLPTRGACHTFVHGLKRLLGDAQVEPLDRFDAEHGPPVIEDDDEDENARRRRKAIQKSKGDAWNELFSDEVNADDDFKIGLSVTPKAAGRRPKLSATEGSVSVKLYTDFYRSDVIISSPLAMKMMTGDDEEDADTDFLSSIEICLVAQADILLMQNWDHVNGVLDVLNLQPKKNNDTDFSRVRPYLLSGQAKHWRQVIISSSFSDPNILSTFKRFAKNHEGAMKLQRRVPVDEASLNNVMVRVRQVFQRIPCVSFAKQGSSRLQYFQDHVLPQILRLKQKHTMIFIPSYFDFVSVRNVLLKKDVDFVSVTEYARVSEVSRGRARFLQGRKPLMLYTGRAHYFSRNVMKGVHHLIFFGLPEHAEFYSGLVNTINKGLEQAEDAPCSCLALFTRYEAHAMERIVGKEHCDRMMKGEKSTYMFVS